MQYSIRPTVVALILTAILGILIGTLAPSVVVQSLNVFLLILAALSLGAICCALKMLYNTRMKPCTNCEALAGTLLSLIIYGVLLLALAIYMSITVVPGTVLFIVEILLLAFFGFGLFASIVQAAFLLFRRNNDPYFDC